MQCIYKAKHIYKIASTKDLASNSSMSSICSPIPIYFIGIFNSDTILNTTPPFAVESSLVNIIPFTLVLS